MDCCKVSIIIPVYNVEKYLSQCLDSILIQEYVDWEIILVDDGSTDSSYEICKKYSHRDSRIKAIHKHNTGVSDSRNVGLKLSTGKYIMFVDADDLWLSSKGLLKLVSTAEKYQLDVLRGEYLAVDEIGKDLFVSSCIEKRHFFAEKLLDSSSFLADVLCGEFFIFLSIFKRSILSDITFNEERSFLEDMEFYSRLLLKPLRTMYVPDKFYGYRKNSNSVSSRIDVKKISDSFAMCSFFNELAALADNVNQKHYYRKYSIMMYYWTLDTLSTDPYYQDRFSISRNLNLYNLNKRVRSWSKSYEGAVPLVVKCAPFIGVALLRCKHTIGYYVRKFKKYAKSFSYRPNL